MIYGTSGYIKHYVSVLALHRLDGWVVPLEIIWDDGRRFSVDVLANGRRSRCQKTPGYATAFKVRVRDVTRTLYRDDIGWFVETAQEGSKHPHALW